MSINFSRKPWFLFVLLYRFNAPAQLSLAETQRYIKKDYFKPVIIPKHPKRSKIKK